MHLGTSGLTVKTIIAPTINIVQYIFIDPISITHSTDDMIMVSGLPSEFNVIPSGIHSNSTFESPDYHRQRRPDSRQCRGCGGCGDYGLCGGCGLCGVCGVFGHCGHCGHCGGCVVCGHCGDARPVRPGVVCGPWVIYPDYCMNMIWHYNK